MQMHSCDTKVPMEEDVCRVMYRNALNHSGIQDYFVDPKQSYVRQILLIHSMAQIMLSLLSLEDSYSNNYE